MVATRANGIGWLSEETVAGATQFNGTAGLGLLDFNDQIANIQRGNTVPRILTFGYTADGAAHEVDVFMVATGGAATERIRIGGSRIKDDGTKSLTNWATIAGCCCLVVPWIAPLAGPISQIYTLQIITSGKTGDATWTVWWDGVGSVG